MFTLRNFGSDRSFEALGLHFMNHAHEAGDKFRKGRHVFRFAKGNQFAILELVRCSEVRERVFANDGDIETDIGARQGARAIVPSGHAQLVPNL